MLACSQTSRDDMVSHSIILGYKLSLISPFLNAGLNKEVVISYGVSRDTYLDASGKHAVNYTFSEYFKQDTTLLYFEAVTKRLSKIKSKQRHIDVSYSKNQVIYKITNEKPSHISSSSDYTLTLTTDDEMFPVQLVYKDSTEQRVVRRYNTKHCHNGLVSIEEYIDSSLFQIHFFSYLDNNLSGWSIYHPEKGLVQPKLFWSSDDLMTFVDDYYDEIPVFYYYKRVSPAFLKKTSQNYQEYLLSENTIRNVLGIILVVDSKETD